jgi:hypothetical protein
MSEMHTRKIPQETRVVIREATETDTAVLAKLQQFPESDKIQ